MATNIRAGKIFVKEDGNRRRAKSPYDYNLGHDKYETIMGQDAPHGGKLAPQIPFIEGVITDGDDIDLKAIVTARDKTITIELANGKTIVGNHMNYAGEGTVNTEEGEIPYRFESDEPLEEV